MPDTLAFLLSSLDCPGLLLTLSLGLCSLLFQGLSTRGVTALPLGKWVGASSAASVTREGTLHTGVRWVQSEDAKYPVMLRADPHERNHPTPNANPLWEKSAPLWLLPFTLAGWRLLEACSLQPSQSLLPPSLFLLWHLALPEVTWLGYVLTLLLFVWVLPVEYTLHESKDPAYLFTPVSSVPRTELCT